MIFMILFAIVVVGLTYFYLNMKYKMTFWRRQKIAEDPGSFPFGSKGAWDAFMQKKTFIEIADHAYNNFKGERIVGTYDFLGRPTIVIRDPELIKQVLVKDFDCFSERQPPGSSIAGPNSKNNKYFAKMLIELRGKEWKKTRSALTPIFTSGKLKAMVPLIHKVADACNLYLKEHAGEEIEGKNLMKLFALDVIVSTGFGFEVNSFKEEDNPFKQHADLIAGEKMDYKTLINFFLFLLSPKLMQWLDLPFFDKKAIQFFANVALQTMQERKESGVRRDDLIDLATEAFSKEKDGEKMSQEEMEDIVISNSLLLFLAGFDTVSSTASLIAYFLAKNQEIQESLYQEISSVVETQGSDKLDYYNVMQMPLLDKVFLESQRCYPLIHLERACRVDYKVPGMDLVIPKDTMVRIPMLAITKNEAYYEKPLKFNPENYNEENKRIRSAYVTGGFGHGPRNCIGLRFATLEVKIAIVRILNEFKFLPCNKTVDGLVPDPTSRTFQPKGGVWFKVEKRDK